MKTQATMHEHETRIRLMTRAYIECLLWCETDDADEPFNTTRGPDNLSGECAARIAADCASFYWRMLPWLEEWDAEQAGHDLHLTRNGHGSGFWDRGRKHGDILAEVARTYYPLTPSLGDDGKIYC